MNRKVENDSGDFKTCPRCSLPHKLTDTVCAYCGEKLPAGVTVTERVRRVVERARWRRKVAGSRKRSGKRATGMVSGGMGILACALLIAVGAWFLYTAVKGGGFSDFLLAVTLTLYGAVAGRNILKKL